MDESIFFKTKVLERLKNRPSDSSRFTRFMIKNVDEWIEWDENQWLDLCFKMKAYGMHCYYDFFYFSINALGINVFDEFVEDGYFLFSEKELLAGTLKYLTSLEYSTNDFELIQEIIRIRKKLKRKYFRLFDVAYKTIVCEGEKVFYVEINRPKKM